MSREFTFPRALSLGSGQLTRSITTTATERVIRRSPRNVSKRSTKDSLRPANFRSSSNRSTVLLLVESSVSTTLGYSSLHLDLIRGLFLEILDLYLPLESTSSILLGSLHDNSLYSYVIGLPPQHKNKLTLISTINVAPCYRQLVNEGWFKASTEFESLFGELPTSLNGVDVPSMRRASVQLGICAEEDSSKETASKTKTNPVTPSSKDPQEAWDDERDSDVSVASLSTLKLLCLRLDVPSF